MGRPGALRGGSDSGWSAVEFPGTTPWGVRGHSPGGGSGTDLPRPSSIQMEARIRSKPGEPSWLVYWLYLTAGAGCAWTLVVAWDTRSALPNTFGLVNGAFVDVYQHFDPRSQAELGAYLPGPEWWMLVGWVMMGVAVVGLGWRAVAAWRRRTPRRAILALLLAVGAESGVVLGTSSVVWAEASFAEQAVPDLLGRAFLAVALYAALVGLLAVVARGSSNGHGFEPKSDTGHALMT